jgi:chemotaxis protein histidine kinase CheA
MIRTTIITTIENLYNMIKKPSEQTTQLYKTTIEQITNMPDPRPLLQLSIRTTNDQRPEQFLQQLLTQILQTIQSIKAEEKPSVASATEAKPEITPPATSTTEVATKPEETVAQPSVATAEKPETVQTITTEAKPQAAPATVAITVATTTQTTTEQITKKEEISEKAKEEAIKTTQASLQESKTTQEASTKETKQETQTKEQEKERTAKEKTEKKRGEKPGEKKKEAETTQAETQKITQSAPPAETPSPTVQEHEKIRTAILDIVKELTQKASPTKEDIINTLQNAQYIVIRFDKVFISPDMLHKISQKIGMDTKLLMQILNIIGSSSIMINKEYKKFYRTTYKDFEKFIS